ncbi:pyridoxal-phosphate dependent enzyme [Streptomyces sp. GD-15H]|uniref:threonine synthase n=1 Tax=Streptomyces sp. GD-15H TaxID=3129112 RepID=UPI003251EC20
MGVVAGDSAPKFALECLRCGHRCEAQFLLRCPVCAGALDARPELAGATVRPADEPELRYLDFLPVASPAFLDPGISVATPCRPAPRLGAAIGVPNLWVKDESRQPTGTVKDRLAAVALAVFRQFGIKEWVASSTGNSATALARAAARDTGMRAHFFCGADFVVDHDLPASGNIELTVLDTGYAETNRAAQDFATQRGLTWEGGFFNWARREGLKLGYLESFDAMPVPPDTVVQAVSSGMGMLAAHKGATEYLTLGRLPAVPGW